MTWTWPPDDLEAALSRLVWAAHGPDPDKVRPVLDALGLAGHPAQPYPHVAARHGITPDHLRYLMRVTQARITHAEIPDTVRAALTEPRTPAPGAGRRALHRAAGYAVYPAPQPDQVQDHPESRLGRRLSV